MSQVTGSRPARSTRGRSPTRTPARSSRRSRSRRRSRRKRSASTRATSTRAAATRRAPRWRRASRRSKARRHGLGFASGLAAEDAVLRTLDPGDHVDHSRRRVRRHVPARRARARALRHRVDRVRPARPRRARGRVARRDPPGVDRDADEPDAQHRRHRGRRRTSRTAATRASSSTTRSRRRTSSSRSRSAPTRRCTRRRSISAATPTSSAGSSRCNDAEWADELRFLQNAMGAVPSPFDCYLVLRGVKTLAVRMRAHCENAQRDRRRCCASTTRSPRCCIPTTSEVAARQMRDFGGMVSFLALDEDTALDVVARTRLFTLAESLGAVESLIEHPARMTHASAAGLAARSRPAPRAPVGRHRVDRRPRRRPASRRSDRARCTASTTGRAQGNDWPTRRRCLSCAFT